jgi:hypothetical protein
MSEFDPSARGRGPAIPTTAVGCGGGSGGRCQDAIDNVGGSNSDLVFVRRTQHQRLLSSEQARGGLRPQAANGGCSPVAIAANRLHQALGGRVDPTWLLWHPR